MVDLGNIPVVAFLISVVPSGKYVGDVVKMGMVFPTLVPGRETVCSLEVSVSSRVIVTAEEWCVGCSVVSVRSKEGPVPLRLVLSFNEYVPV